jgi:hypothetical protein
MYNSFYKHHVTDDALAFTVFVDITFSHVNKFLLPRTHTSVGLAVGTPALELIRPT